MRRSGQIEDPKLKFRPIASRYSSHSRPEIPATLRATISGEMSDGVWGDVYAIPSLTVSLRLRPALDAALLSNRRSMFRFMLRFF